MSRVPFFTLNVNNSRTIRFWPREKQYNRTERRVNWIILKIVIPVRRCNFVRDVKFIFVYGPPFCVIRYLFVVWNRFCHGVPHSSRDHIKENLPSIFFGISTPSFSQKRSHGRDMLITTTRDLETKLLVRPPSQNRDVLSLNVNGLLQSGRRTKSTIFLLKSV